jgi:hypothetical protein
MNRDPVPSSFDENPYVPSYSHVSNLVINAKGFIGDEKQSPPANT